MSVIVHRDPDTLPTWRFGWGAITWHVTPDSVPGAASTVGEVIINPGQGHSAHTHDDADEILYIIDGVGEQTVGDHPSFRVVAGDAVNVPRGTVHSTFNRGWRPLRILAVYTPGGAEEALRSLPDFEEIPAGEAPRWVQA